MDVPKAIAYRIARYHLCDNTRGEPPAWRLNQVRKATLRLTVEGTDDGTVTLRLDGEVLLATDADPKRADRGFDARLLGHLRYHTEKRALERFDVVAMGEHWGEGLATDAIELVLQAMDRRGSTIASLWCLEENHRARRLYEYLGWRPEPERREAPWPPHPTEVRYSRLIIQSDR